MPSLSASFLNLDHQPTWRLVWMAWRGRCLTLAWCQSKSFQREIVQSPWSRSAPPRREELGIWQVILSSVLSWATAKRQIPVEGRLLLLCWHHSMRKFSREKFRQTDLIDGGKNRTVRAVISLRPFSRLFWVKTAHAALCACLLMSFSYLHESLCIFCCYILPYGNVLLTSERFRSVFLVCGGGPKDKSWECDKKL